MKTDNARGDCEGRKEGAIGPASEAAAGGAAASGAAASGAAGGPGGRRPFVAPRLERHDDLVRRTGGWEGSWATK